MKELCHSNETWHALNSTFPDTNSIVYFQINPHWISNSGLWKVVARHFMNGLENWRRESCFTRTMFLHTSLWLQWLLCVTVALNWLIILHFLLIWHHMTNFSSPTWKKLSWWTGLPSSVFQAVVQSPESLIQCGFIWKETMQSVSGNVEFNACQVSLLWHYSFLVSLWTFQPTLAYNLSYSICRVEH